MWVNLKAFDLLACELNMDVRLGASVFVGRLLIEHAEAVSSHVGSARCPSCSSEDVEHYWSEEQDAPTDACLVYRCQGCDTRWHDRYEAVSRVIWEKEVPDVD